MERWQVTEVCHRCTHPRIDPHPYSDLSICGQFRFFHPTRGHGDTACKQFESSERSVEKLSQSKLELTPSWRMAPSLFNTATPSSLARLFGPIHARGLISSRFRLITASDERRPGNFPAGFFKARAAPPPKQSSPRARTS